MSAALTSVVRATRRLSYSPCMPQMPPLERALFLAQTGEVLSLGQIRKRMAKEGYSFADIAAALDGQITKRKLRDVISAARLAPSAS